MVSRPGSTTVSKTRSEAVEGGASPRVVFVGKRRPALEAARALGLEVILWSERSPGRSELPLVARHLRLLPAGPLANVDEAAAALCGAGPVAAVVALSEGSVPAAAALRERLGVRGESLTTARRCSDKLLMKRAVAAAGLACAAFVGDDEAPARSELLRRLGLPMVLKPRVGWGGRGASVLRREEEVPARLPRGYVAESFVSGEEMSLEALVDRGRRIFTNATEYLEPGWANLVPRPLDAPLRRELGSLADRAIEVLGVRRGMVHLEIFLTAGGPLFGELAARPPGGYILRLIELAYGFEPWRAWLRLETGSRPRTVEAAGRVAAVRLLYPGAGRVTRIRGVEAARALPGIVEVSVRVRPGQELGPRLGVGQEAGRIVATGADRDSAVRALESARRLVTIEVSPG